MCSQKRSRQHAYCDAVHHNARGVAVEDGGPSQISGKVCSKLGAFVCAGFHHRHCLVHHYRHKHTFPCNLGVVTSWQREREHGERREGQLGYSFRAVSGGWHLR